MKKKLNNKGFTLIELLAVVVILAVVMGIAVSSVLKTMNTSRKGSLEDSALTAADAFRTAYAESLINNDKVLGFDTLSVGKNYLTEDSFRELSISADNYVQADDGNASFVYFDGTAFTVCLVANDSGRYYVAGAVIDNEKDTGLYDETTPIKLTGIWACSNGNNSWE